MLPLTRNYLITDDYIRELASKRTCKLPIINYETAQSLTQLETATLSLMRGEGEEAVNVVPSLA